MKNVGRSIPLAILAALVLFIVLGGCGAEAPESVETNTPLPAGLRLAALRALQQAPGYDFESRGNTFTARMGEHGGEARATLEAGRVSIVPADGSFALGIRTTGRPIAWTRVRKVKGSFGSRLGSRG